MLIYIEKKEIDGMRNFGMTGPASLSLKVASKKNGTNYLKHFLDYSSLNTLAGDTRDALTDWYPTLIKIITTTANMVNTYIESSLVIR
jgi:hypothetical protein